MAELDEVALAYATTVHKSQGSEYPAVVIPLATQHYPMLARNLLYTGVTRGKQLVVLIGQPKACALAVRNVRAMRRLTNLAARLRLGGHGHGDTGITHAASCSMRGDTLIAAHARASARASRDRGPEHQPPSSAGKEHRCP